ncbi:hypothetical protein [Protaetiibacter mangrovi]|uniref:DUF2147 domain-containing protein n=1 Tax=Protaetiibacter mangrovi TaxID=2970926 RepID=A0ABT1ZCV6_9MICO|nr:hypothetical protein [Protaetiibacter mangrovi]MCS0498515.1 hypothetical protein [Protaetiibacter mangrovi]TPX02849.1 hypothetical protein FJ656_20260 [Schumannella luteola]
MTTTLTPATPAPAPVASGIRWASVAEGLWAGTRDGEFLGTVEFVDGGFETADERGTRIGRSHSLVAAQRLVESPAPDEESVLGWRDERPVLAAGWLGFAALAVTAVGLAWNLYV